MKTLLSSIDIEKVQKLLHVLKAQPQFEEDVVMEYFDYNPHKFFTWNMNIIPYEFQNMFTMLEKHVQKGSLTSQGLYLTLIDKNEDCFMVLHHIHPKRKQPLHAIASIQFHLYEWANVEELLLEHGFELICTIEEQRISYHLKKMNGECTVVIPPNAPAYMEVTADTEADMKTILAELGYTLEQVEYIER